MILENVNKGSKGGERQRLKYTIIRKGGNRDPLITKIDEATKK